MKLRICVVSILAAVVPLSLTVRPASAQPAQPAPGSDAPTPVVVAPDERAPAPADAPAPKEPEPNLVPGAPQPAAIAEPPVTADQHKPDEPAEGSEEAKNRHLRDLHARLAIKGWNIVPPSFVESVTQDAGGWRSKLAEAGIGLTAWSTTQMATQLLNNPRTSRGGQVYWGQTTSVGEVALAFLTFDAGKVGLKGGQLQLGTDFNRSTYDPFTPKAWTFYRISYYQSLFKNRFEFAFGIMGNATTWVGTYVGGQLSNPFGPNASVPAQLGLASSAVGQPTAWVRVRPTESTYNLAGVARSMNPGGVQPDLEDNPLSLKLTQPGAHALYIDEIGYRKAASQTQRSTWFRAGAVYNTTRYTNFTGGKSQKFGAYGLYDIQLLKSSAVKETANRGLYAGASYMWTSPHMTTFNQYIEGRVYALGLFDARPQDNIIFVYSHNEASRVQANRINDGSDTTGNFAAYGTNTVTGTYTGRLSNGIYLTGGLQYVDRPSFTYIAGSGHALNFISSLYVVL